MSDLYVIENEHLSMRLNLSSGIAVESIKDKVTNFEFLMSPSPLFMFAVNHGYGYCSNTLNPGNIPGVVIDSVSLSADAKMLSIVCHDNLYLGYTFSITISTPSGSIAAIVETSVTNNSGAESFLKVLMPRIINLTTPGFSIDPLRKLGMLPQEIGGVVTMTGGIVLGNPPATDAASVELPTGINAMEVANLYDRDGGGGIFFADLDGDFSLGKQTTAFMLGEYDVQGIFVKQAFQASNTVSLPRSAIGVNHSGDYHTAVQYYVNAHSADWSFPTVPAWFKEAGAVWSTNEEGSGGSYQILPRIDLNTQISSFTELPLLYDQAAAMGTNLFYLNDYWEKDPQVPSWPYLNKGDYIPRSDLGGATALIQGIEGIHAKGGKVIAYVEGYIFWKDASIAQQSGSIWSMRMADGNPYTTYPDQISLHCKSPGWVNYAISVCTRLVNDYGIDGIFFDSTGWQMNRSAKSTDYPAVCTNVEWNQGVYTFIDSVRTAIRTIKPDAIVMSESGSSGLFFHEDGGLTADFAWNAGCNQNRIIASPIRFGIPQANLFSNGDPDNLNQLAQVYAAGHSLAVDCLWNNASSYIKTLLDTRRTYKDALIYGQQAYQPNTGTMWVAAYMYRGTSNKVMTIVNVANTSMSINLQLDVQEQNSLWYDILSGEIFTANGTMMPVTMPEATSGIHGLRILVQTAITDPGFESQTTNNIAAPWSSTGGCGIDLNLGFQFCGNNNAWIIPQYGIDNRIYRDIAVEPNTNYRLMGYIQTSGMDVDCRFGVMTLDNSILEEIPIGYNQFYYRMDVDFNSGSNNSVRIYLCMTAQQTITWARLDNVVLTKPQ